MQLDYGNNKQVGLAAMVEYARTKNGQGYEKYLQKVRGMSFKHFVSGGETLENSSNYGFAPVDAVRERVSWTTLRKKYSVADLVNWGMTFETAVKIGLKPSQVGGSKGFEVLKNMGATEEQLKEFLYNFDAIKTSGLGPGHLKDAGFSFEDLLNAGCTANNMKQLEGFDIKSMVLAFEPTGQQWLAANFTDDTVKKAGWDASLYRRFVANKTCEVVPEAVEELTIVGRPKSMSEARAVLPPEPNASVRNVVAKSKSLNFKLI